MNSLGKSKVINETTLVLLLHQVYNYVVRVCESWLLTSISAHYTVHSSECCTLRARERVSGILRSLNILEIDFQWKIMLPESRLFQRQILHDTAAGLSYNNEVRRKLSASRSTIARYWAEMPSRIMKNGTWLDGLVVGTYRHYRRSSDA